MKDLFKIVSVVGARPQFIKMAPMERAMLCSGKISSAVIHTGQHYDHAMSQVFFDELSIAPPDYNLEIGSGPHGAQTAGMLAGIEEILIDEKPDLCIVYGDTNSTLAGSLAAAKLHIPIAHVEAGLRSFNRRMPEEINRILTDHTASLLFCPTQTAIANLRNEGITGGVFNVGDVMYDAFLQFSKKAELSAGILATLNVKKNEFILCTVHRAENTDSSERFADIIGALNDIACKGYSIILPMHPRTRKILSVSNLKLSDKITVCSPLSYLELVYLENAAKLILTDSGGIQKEAFFAKTPCLTLRDETEWVETLESGCNKVCGAKRSVILDAFERVMLTSPEFSGDVPYGKGDAAEQMCGFIIDYLTERR